MTLSTETGAIAYTTLEAMNNAIASLKDKCGFYYFDDIVFKPNDFDYVIEATLVYSEADVNFYLPMRQIYFTRISADKAFRSCLRAMLPNSTMAQIEHLAARLKRQF